MNSQHTFLNLTLLLFAFFLTPKTSTAALIAQEERGGTNLRSPIAKRSLVTEEKHGKALANKKMRNLLGDGKKKTLPGAPILAKKKKKKEERNLEEFFVGNKEVAVAQAKKKENKDMIDGFLGRSMAGKKTPGAPTKDNQKKKHRKHPEGSLLGAKRMPGEEHAKKTTP